MMNRHQVSERLSRNWRITSMFDWTWPQGRYDNNKGIFKIADLPASKAKG